MYFLIKGWTLNLISRRWAKHSSLGIEIIITLPLQHVLGQEMFYKWEWRISWLSVWQVFTSKCVWLTLNRRRKTQNGRVGVCMRKATKTNVEFYKPTGKSLLCCNWSVGMCMFKGVGNGCVHQSTQKSDLSSEWGCSASHGQTKASGLTLLCGYHSEIQGETSGVIAWPHLHLPIWNPECARALCGWHLFIY